MDREKNAATLNGEPPMHFAVQKRREGNILALLEHGSNDRYTVADGTHYYARQPDDQSPKLKVYKWKGDPNKWSDRMHPVLSRHI